MNDTSKTPQNAIKKIETNHDITTSVKIECRGGMTVLEGNVFPTWAAFSLLFLFWKHGEIFFYFLKMRGFCFEVNLELIHRVSLSCSGEIPGEFRLVFRIVPKMFP